MRLAYVCADPGVPVFGRKGASVHIQEVVAALRRRRTDVVIFAARVDGVPPPRLDGVRIHALPCGTETDPSARERSALAANRVVARALRQAGTVDAVYERYALWSFAGMEHARESGIAGLLEVNAPLVEEQAIHRVLIDRAGAESASRRALDAATALLAVSTEVATYLEGFPGMKNKINLVPNGVDPVRFRPGIQAALPRAPGTFTIGFVGSLKPWHGLDIVVEAFAILHRDDPRSRLLIVGDGPEAQRLQDAVTARGLAAVVILTGAVNPDQVPGLLASTDVAVAVYPELPRFYFSPMKLYEYLAMGLPVVASRSGQVARIIQDGHNGVLCEPGDVQGLATALDRLRADPALRKRLAQGARETIERGHTWDTVADHILAIAVQARHGSGPMTGFTQTAG